MAMYEITLQGTSRERGCSQGEAFRQEIRALINECRSLWLARMPEQRVAAIQGQMMAYLQKYWPALVDELHGIAAGANLPLVDVCTINFVSAISALGPRCSNVVVLDTAEGPLHGKTSDIGEDYRYYCLQRVIPERGLSYLAVSWLGCLWAEVGINSAGYCVGQGSAPILPGQDGYGVPTLEYPRALLASCPDTASALVHCARLDMAGKGLNMAMVDATGDAAVVERSGTRHQVRRAQGGLVFCTNHFLGETMQGMLQVSAPGLSQQALRSDSAERLADIGRHFTEHPPPWRRADVLWLLQHHRSEGGLCQNQPPLKVTHYAYLLLPRENEFWISQGRPWETEFIRYTVL